MNAGPTRSSRSTSTVTGSGRPTKSASATARAAKSCCTIAPLPTDTKSAPLSMAHCASAVDRTLPATPNRADPRGRSTKWSMSRPSPPLRGCMKTSHNDSSR